MKTLLLLLMIAASMPMQGQPDLPYREIPAYPEKYSGATVAARIVDGLGFRYYWATEGLRPEDLTFQPNKDGRTTLETITHIYDLTRTLANATKKLPNISNPNPPVLSFEEMRRKTLENIQVASEILKKSTDEDLNEFKVIFKNDRGTTEYPFWNALNGPIADALWHTGQVVSFRRGSGNPYNAKASVFTGKVRE
ncbi:MAG: hypothetical protein SH819_00325 [Cytophagales bacterium]|nr:hypothetical protein [Cytophagales bacterium]